MGTIQARGTAPAPTDKDLGTIQAPAPTHKCKPQFMGTWGPYKRKELQLIGNSGPYKRKSQHQPQLIGTPTHGGGSKLFMKRVITISLNKF